MVIAVRKIKFIIFIISFLSICGVNENLIEKKIPRNIQYGYGSGGIINCEEYLKNKYDGEVTEIDSDRLEMINIPQNEFKNNVGNCAIVAITRVLDYYAKNGYLNIDTRDPYEFYQIVEDIAVKKCGYEKEKGGVKAIQLKNILVEVLKYCKSEKILCKQRISVWNFDKHIKKEINEKRPIILSNFIKRGWYGGHALTVCGYKIYNIRKKICGITINKKYPMIEVYDGWSDEVRYVDYRAYNKEVQRYASIINLFKKK